VADSVHYLLETLKDPLPNVGEENGTTKGRRRTYRMHGSSPTWQEIFDILENITGRKYQVSYLDIEGAQQEEAEALRDGDVDKELSASHKLIQAAEVHCCQNLGIMTAFRVSNPRNWRTRFEKLMTPSGTRRCMAYCKIVSYGISFWENNED